MKNPEKREAGENPARSRRCKVESAQKYHYLNFLKPGGSPLEASSHLESRREGCADDETEPEELPVFCTKEIYE